MSDPVVRPATRSDVPTFNAIYNTYIVGSHVSFDLEAWTDADRVEWFESRVEHRYPVLVAEIDGVVVGTAWAGPWRDKKAYRATVETTVVLARDTTGKGVGTALYSQLLEDLTNAGFHRAIAIVSLPNDASIALHHKLGFVDAGVLDDAGFKDGKFVSTLLLQRPL